LRTAWHFAIADEIRARIRRHAGAMHDERMGNQGCRLKVEHGMKTYDLPEAATALWLSDHTELRGDTVFIARGAAKLDRLARLCAGFCAGRVDLLVLPPWDVLPYDHAAPSIGVTGRRVETLARLAGPPGPHPRLLLVSAGAALQRVRPSASWAGTGLQLKVGDAVDRDQLRLTLQRKGYHFGPVASDPGDIALHEHVIDIVPAGASTPVRLAVADGRIAAMHRLDPESQRSQEAVACVDVFPAMEFMPDPAGLGADDEPALPHGALVSLFTYTKAFGLCVDGGVEARWAELRDHIADSFQNQRSLVRHARHRFAVLPPPDQLYLTPAETAACLAKGEAATPAGRAKPLPSGVQDLVQQARTATGPVVIAAPGDPERLARSLAKRELRARAAHDWSDAVSGGITCWSLDIDGGFSTSNLSVLQAGHLLRTSHAATTNGFASEHPLRIGDIVVHVDHGAARLAGLRPIEFEGAAAERLALAFADDSELLVDPLELDRIWRYGSVGALDRLRGEAWRARRAEIETEIHEIAQRLSEQAAARASCRAPVLAHDRAIYERLSLRFPYALSGDQRAAVDAVLSDLRRGTPMNRLVCGDVGFGKTEVALRATAAAALSGWQVAVVAPTTVLARQHLDTFRRRFAGTAVRVELLTAGADGQAVRDGLADGSVGVVVGTQTLASEALDFAVLGLVIIDEEQRLGEEQKLALTERPHGLGAVHVLTMTATPIPRTMQQAMVGLRDVSVIATAPLNRQATRTLVVPFDATMLRDALLREHARGGQSFIVCPRIRDLNAVAEQVAAVAPELHLVQAHGRMKPYDLEAAVVDFAAGHGDVLLATNIIEAGLDIPRANTVIVLHPDRFGLAQLHQVRGRVGRGARRGTAYLMTDPGRTLAPATLARLQALEAASSLGAGIALSTADMDQRGAGELFGTAQAGHVSSVGTELYQHLLLQAVRVRQGAAAIVAAPVMHVGLNGRIPEEYVTEAELRMGLYRRLARLQEVDGVDAFAEELHDRFGPPPLPLQALLALARLRCVGAMAGVRHLESGPRGISIALHDETGPAALAIRLSELAERLGGVIRNDRLVVPLQKASPMHRVGELISLLGSTASTAGYAADPA